MPSLRHHLLPGSTTACLPFCRAGRCDHGRLGGGDLARTRRELRVQQLALPLSLAMAWVLVSASAGQFFVRTFLSMWLHEFGHASAAWLCGHGAVPGPWRTWWSQGRVAPVILLIAASLGGLGWVGWRAGRRDLVAAAVLGLTLQLACTVLAPDAAGALITFGGDGQCSWERP